jgi:hypothetical protein
VDNGFLNMLAALAAIGAMLVLCGVTASRLSASRLSR